MSSAGPKLGLGLIEAFAEGDGIGDVPEVERNSRVQMYGRGPTYDCPIPVWEREPFGLVRTGEFA
jgi:hypothetical protein